VTSNYSAQYIVFFHGFDDDFSKDRQTKKKWLKCEYNSI